MAIEVEKVVEDQVEAEVEDLIEVEVVLED